MLLEYMRKEEALDGEASSMVVSDLQKFYRSAKEAFDEDNDFRKKLGWALGHDICIYIYIYICLFISFFIYVFICLFIIILDYIVLLCFGGL